MKLLHFCYYRQNSYIKEMYDFCKKYCFKFTVTTNGTKNPNNRTSGLDSLKKESYIKRKLATEIVMASIRSS